MSVLDDGVVDSDEEMDKLFEESKKETSYQIKKNIIDFFVSTNNLDSNYKKRGIMESHLHPTKRKESKKKNKNLMKSF